MLLERIVPGLDLTTVHDHAERLALAAGLASRLPVPAVQDQGFPTYSSWAARAFRRAREEGRVGPRMLFFLDMAETLLGEILELDRPQVLLHGDLHRENILQDQGGDWKAIDPKGVLGPRCLEAGRYMLDELCMTPRPDRLRRLDGMARVFGASLGKTGRTMALCFFVDLILSRCWSFDEDPTPREARALVDQCETGWAQASALL